MRRFSALCSGAPAPLSVLYIILCSSCSACSRAFGIIRCRISPISRRISERMLPLSAISVYFFRKFSIAFFSSTDFVSESALRRSVKKAPV